MVLYIYIYILYMYMYDLCMYIINKYMYIICLCYYTHIYIYIIILCIHLYYLTQEGMSSLFTDDSRDFFSSLFSKPGELRISPEYQGKIMGTPFFDLRYEKCH